MRNPSRNSVAIGVISAALFVCNLLGFPHAALAQSVNCATCVATANCPCPGGGCNIPGGIGCTDPGGCTGLPGTCLFVPGAPLGAAAGSIEAEEAGRRLVCAIRAALANNVPQVYVCGRYSILLADEFGTDVAAFKKIGASNVLTVSGRSTDPANAIIQISPNAANPKFRFFFVENGGRLTLQNLTLQDGRAGSGTNSSGGAVFVESTSAGNGLASRFDATNCVFNNNFALADGGAIRFEDGNRDPNAGSDESRSFFRLTRCVFTNNIAQQQGGGVATSDISIVEGCTFTANRAGPTGPPATGLGGGFWAGPRAVGGGSGSAPVFMRSSTMPAMITTFTNNIAGEGGGMFVRGPGERQLTSVVFKGNQAQAGLSGTGETGGGAFHGELSDLVTMFGCTFGGTLAGEPNFTTLADGGAILSESTNMEVVNSFFFNNTGFNVGGAARMTGSQRSLFRQCTIQGNSAPSGGGVYVDNNAGVAFDDCILRLNTANGATGAGGGLYLGGGRPFLYNCTLTANQAFVGAGIYNNGAGTAMLHCTIADIRGAGRAFQFGPKPSDPVVIQNSIVGDLWTGPVIGDNAFTLPLPSQVNVRFSDIEMTNANLAVINALAGNGGNINCDPLFTDLANGNVHLTACSPCIDRASESQGDMLFDGVLPLGGSGQWGQLLSAFFAVCNSPFDGLGHCSGDYDDNAATDDLSPADGFSDRDSNPNITDSPAVSQTLRKTACESDMGADEFVRVLIDSIAVFCDADGPGPIPPTAPDPETNLCSARCAGDPFCFRSQFTGQCPAGVSYQWYFRADLPQNPASCFQSPTEYVPIPGATSADLCFPTLSLSNSGCYRLVVTRPVCGGPGGFLVFALGRGTTTTDCVTELAACICLQVLPGPAPMVNNAAVCVGGAQTLEQIASLPSLPEGYTYTYQWFFKGTSDCLTTPCPAGECTGGTALTNGARPSGTLVAGATTASLALSNVQLAERGCYYVFVDIDGPDEGTAPDGSDCATASNCACLTVVNPLPTVNNAAVCLGGTQTLEQTATLPPLPAGYTYTFQWFFRGTSNCLTTPCPNGDCSGGTTVTNGGRFSGATTPNLTITGATAADAGCYYVVIGLDGPEGPAQDGPKCNKFSNCACLTVVNPAPNVNNAAVCLGGTQTLEQTATLPTLPANYTYTFQWFFRGTSNCLTTPCPNGDCTGGTTVTNGGRFSGATTPNLTITGATAADAGCYYVVVGVDGPEGPAQDGPKCAKASNCACLTVVTPLPSVNNAAVCLGGTQTLEQTSNLPALPANYTYTFQWFFRGTSNCLTTPCPNGDCTGGTTVTNGGRFSGATTPNLTITGATAADAGCYYVVVGVDGPEGPAQDGPKCAKASNCACLSVVTPLPTVNNAAVCLGGTQTLEQTASLPSLPANYTYTFQWFFRGTSNCLTTPCPNGDCTGGTTVTNGGRFSGATTPNLTITGATAADAGCYYVVVGVDGPESPAIDLLKCQKSSNCACLTVVNPAPSVVGRTVCVGGDQSLTVNSGSFPALPANYTYTFQWFFRGTSDCNAAPCPTGTCSGGTALTNIAPYSGVDTPTLHIEDVQLVHQGCYYVVIGLDGPEGPAADGPKCNIFSNCACLRVVPQPTFSVQPVDKAVCVGGRQTLTATVTNPTGLTLCLQWYRKERCDLLGEGTPVANGAGISGATTNTLVFDPAAPAHEGCYYLRARICNPDDPTKCPWVDSACACLDVRPPLVPCVLDCTSGETDAQGRCLFCAGVDISLCCTIPNAEGPLCYQWQYCATSGPTSCFVDIVGATDPCFVIEDFDPSVDTGCYRVRINYLDLSGANCPETSDKCDAVYSLPLCVAETARCCPETCDCKNNADPLQTFYSLWKTGDWDGESGEWSFDRSAADGVVIKAADDFFLDPASMHHITRFLGEMLLKQSNPLIEYQAKLHIYADCNGAPGEEVAVFDSDCAAFVSGAPDGFSRYQFKFDLSTDCIWLRGGTYWASLVAIGPPQDNLFEAYWVTAGIPGTPPIPIVKGRRPVFMEGLNDWTEFDPCCHPCSDLQFCLSGTTCPIIWDNGLPYLGGADANPPGTPPFQVLGTRSEKSTLPVRNSRAADQFVVKTCESEEVCYLEGYIFTNCTGFEVHLEIYENDCREPQFMLPAGSPIYYPSANPSDRPIPTIIDLGYTGLKVGTTSVRAYKVVFCDWPTPLVLQAGKNYWLSLSVKDSFTTNERAFFSHIKQPCDPCTTPSVWKIDPGMELAPGRQITDWQSVGADFAFLIATRKPADSLPAGEPPDGQPCIVDVNNNNTVDVQDIFLFLSAWFAGCP